MRALALALLCSPLCLACAPADPYYDEALGVEGVPVDVGALAGTFALKTRSLNLETVPVLGEQEGGGTNLRLVTRAWDDAAGVYRQQSVLCSGVSYEVGGVTQFVSDETYQKVPASVNELVEVEHETGFYVGTGHLQLWGLRDLPDPYETPLPTTPEEAEEEPHASRIYDLEGDGHPGVTLQVEGLVSGDIYGIFRKTVDLEGVTLGPDKAVGFSLLDKESVQLGADSELLKVEGSASWRRFPDPRESWFEEIRLEEGAGCDEVRAAEDDGRLTLLGPLPR